MTKWMLVVVVGAAEEMEVGMGETNCVETNVQDLG